MEVKKIILSMSSIPQLLKLEDFSKSCVNKLAKLFFHWQIS